MTRGYFEIGIYQPKTDTNVGTLWRSAYQLGAQGIFTIGRRYKRQASDTVNAMLQIPLRHYNDLEDFLHNRPINSSLVGIEMGGRLVENFVHPNQVTYLLGAEDYGLPDDVLERCNHIVSLGSITTLSYNVSVAGSIVMYHRFMQRQK